MGFEFWLRPLLEVPAGVWVEVQALRPSSRTCCGEMTKGAELTDSPGSHPTGFTLSCSQAVTECGQGARKCLLLSIWDSFTITLAHNICSILSQYDEPGVHVHVSVCACVCVILASLTGFIFNEYVPIQKHSGTDMPYFQKTV